MTIWTLWFIFDFQEKDVIKECGGQGVQLDKLSVQWLNRNCYVRVLSESEFDEIFNKGRGGWVIVCEQFHCNLQEDVAFVWNRLQTRDGVLKLTENIPRYLVCKKEE